MIDLNNEQKACVTTESRNALVLAPPGGGKTRCIVERTAHLIENCKVAPSELILLTFSRKAAGEMRERIEERIGLNANKIKIATFHAMALSLLHQFGELIGFSKTHSTVYGDFETQFLLKEVAKDLGKHTGKAWKGIKKRDIDAVFDKYYQEGIEPDKEDPAYGLFKAFVTRCRENNSYTFGSLLTGLKLLLPEIQQYLKWKHIIVDETQDTDRLQWELINTLKSRLDATLFVVSDPDQCVYSWRGADADYFLRHQDEFDIFKLETNYRSDPAIVEAANNLIQHNENRIEKTMKPSAFKAIEPGMHEPVKILRNAQSAWLSGYLKAFHKDGKAPVVLARNHFLLKKLSGLLDESRVPHTYIGKTTAMTNSEEFRRFHAFLKLIVNSFDNFSFLLVKDLIGLNSKEYAGIRLRAAQEGKSHFDIWYQHTENDWTAFYDSIEQWDFLELSAQLHLLLQNTVFDEAYNFTSEWADWVGKKPPQDTIQQYLDHLALVDIQDEIKETTDGIQLMTAHASKGLEFQTVIFIGANESIIPSKQSLKEDGDIQGERRLMYVGVTRAIDQLIIAVRPEQTEDKRGRVYINPESRFVAEMEVEPL